MMFLKGSLVIDVELDMVAFACFLIFECVLYSCKIYKYIYIYIF